MARGSERSGDRSVGECLATRVGDQAGDHVGIHVGVRATILDVTLLVKVDLPRNPNRCTTVRDAIAELVKALRLVCPSEALLGPESVAGNVLSWLALGAKSLTGPNDGVVALTHRVR